MRERVVELGPVGLTDENERVQPAEQAKRGVPRQLADERRHALVGGETATEVGVERRAALAMGRLAPEGLRLVVVGQAALEVSCAAFACSAIAVKAAGSATARSARTLRSSSIPALCRPEMNWL